MVAAAITKNDLLARLAQGHAAGITVVTPNRRLALVLKSEFDRFQIAKGLPAWEDADILPFSAWIERLHEEALYSRDAAELPQLLTGAQERALWESILAGSGLLAVPEAAAQCADARRLAHAWRIAGALEKFPGNEDTAAFARWARQYERRCKHEGWVDFAVLPDLVSRNGNEKIKSLVAYGYDILPPQAADCLSAFKSFSCKPEKTRSTTGKTSFPFARHELEAAARWARARLEAGAQRIGVVVPGIEQRRREVARVFARVMRPGGVLKGATRVALPFNLSLGEPLHGYAIVDFALNVLEFSFHEIEFSTASRLIRSPFLAGAEAEFAARARLDAQLRKRLPARLTLPRLIAEVKGCPVLRSLLEKTFLEAKAIKNETETPDFWARHFTDLLEAAGFPGERALDSEEFQAHAKFSEALGELSRLGLVLGKISAGEAVRRLRRICAETLFQPESAEAPVQVMGILESAGLEFDHLWVSGLTDQAWPLHASPNPFLPVALQKKAGIPEASAESSLALDRRITEGWMGAAPEVVFSWPAKEEDRDLAPSPLLGDVPLASIENLDFPNFIDVLFSSGKTEEMPDGKAPPLASNTVRGGSRVLADQAACPFRAFARHRLGAEPPEAPAPGLDATDRGKLLHELMKGLWSQLKSSASLSGNLQPSVEKAAAAAVNALEIEGRFAELEKKRLEKLALEWLEVERGRKGFEVVGIERPLEMKIANLSLKGRIDRLDRLEDGSHALIDYKSGGRVTPNDWLGERPDDPQLPLYALSAAEDIGAVAFARLKTGEMKFSGFSSEKNQIPGVKQAQDWNSLFTGWKFEIEKLAKQFSSGEARVDPKKGFQTCRNCGLQPLCRVHERLDALADADGEGE